MYKPFYFISGTLLLLVCLCLNTTTINAQKMLSIEDAVLGRETGSMKSLSPKNLIQLQWLPSGKKASYVVKDKIAIWDLEKGTVDSSITAASFNTANKSTIGSTYKIMESFPAFKWIDNSSFRFQLGNIWYSFNIVSNTTKKITEIPAENVSVEYHEGSNNVAYTKDENIYVVTAGGETKQVTTDGKKGLVYGETVHRSEFGITKGLFWSNDGKKLAFYRMDESMVPDYFIYNNNTIPASSTIFKYPTAGSVSHHVTIGIYNVETGKTAYLQTGEPAEQYLTNITWSPDNNFVYVAIVNRGQNQMNLNRYRISDGGLDLNLFEEKHEKYVEPEHGPSFLPNDHTKFIWLSERDGFNHLYLYSTDGKLVKQLTQGNWLVTEIIGYSAKGDKVFFTSTKDSPLERQLYSVAIKSGAITKLTKEIGTHAVLPNATCSYFIDNVSSIDIPHNINIISEKGENKKIMLTAPNPLAEYSMGKTTLFPITHNGTELYCRMITPPNFDSTKKYPVVVYLYGGPHAQMNVNRWLAGSNLWMQYMAQQGYIVFTLDNRGSDNRGLAFENSVFRQLGTLEMEDQLAGVAFLKNLRFVDGSRMGIHGWSFGGLMTTTMMTRAPGVFKVGVAGGPVIDWKIYEIMYTERYMDTPEENPEGYKKANLLGYANNLQDKLLMIHGCDDDVVLWQHSLLYSKTCVDNNNINLDYFVYPGHKHNVQGKNRVHLMKKISQYLVDNI
ncbi:MAG: S9 family peptidase [Bacteroidia bacterium]|nr:S9 family peptidase [Bacteroidia bacterium]